MSERDRRRWLVALICITWLWVIAPRTLQSLEAPKFLSTVGADSVPYTGAARLTLSLLTYAVFLCCAGALVFSVRDLPRERGFALFVVVLPWIYLVVRDEYLTIPLHKSAFFYPLLAVTLWALRPRLGDLQVLGYLAGATALISIVLAIALPAKGILRSSHGDFIAVDKQFLPWGTLIGPFTNGNNLGQFLIMSVPAVMLIQHRILRWATLTACIVALLWSASRSSLITLLILAAVGLALRLVQPRAKAVLGSLAVVGLTAVVVALPLLTTDPGAFTNRGYIWRQSLDAWSTDPTFGLGANWYSVIGSSSATLGGSVFHGHNEYVQLLVTGGVLLAIGLGLVLLVATAAAARLAAAGHSFGVLWLLSLLGACLLEVSYVLVDRDFLVPVMVIPLASVLFARPDQRPQPQPDVRQASRAVPV